MMLRDYWYIACAASRLGSIPVAARVLDQDLVLFRNASGSPHALLDRCCHRGARLSLGRVTDGTLACGYHGWRYDGTGQCIHIPSLAKERRIPSGVQVLAYPCIEQDSYLWVWLGERRTPPPVLSGIPEFSQHHWYQGSIAFRCAALKVIENNLDWCHASFTHVDTHPQYFRVQKYGFSEYAYELRITDRGLVAFTPTTPSESDPIPAHNAVVLTFELPDRLKVDLREPMRMTILMHVIPTGSNTCRLEWLVTNPSRNGSQVSWSDAEPEVFAQDRRILESSQPWYDREGSEFERSVEADASTLLARRIIELAADGQWEQKRSSLPQRRVVRIRG